MKYLNVIAAVVVAVLMAVLSYHVIENPSQEDEPDRIGIIGAMDEEVTTLKDAMHIDYTKTIAGMNFVVGTLGSSKIVVAQCGMGKVNAGTCAQLLIRDFNARAIINTGVAGSLDDTLKIGDFVISTDVVQHDFDVSDIGFVKGEIPYTGKISFDADPVLRSKAVTAINTSCPGVPVYQGRMCTGDQFISTTEEREAITSYYGGLSCDMEGGAIGQVCYLNNVPFVIMRVMSDTGLSPEEYEKFMHQSAERSASAVMYMLEHGAL